MTPSVGYLPDTRHDQSGMDWHVRLYHVGANRSTYDLALLQLGLRKLLGHRWDRNDPRSQLLPEHVTATLWAQKRLKDQHLAIHHRPDAVLGDVGTTLGVVYPDRLMRRIYRD